MKGKAMATAANKANGKEDLQSRNRLQKDRQRWEEILKTLRKDQQHTVIAETAAIRQNNRLEMGKHLDTIRKIIVPSLALNPKRKVGTKDPRMKHWAVFFKANLRGISRASSYHYMAAWVAATKRYPGVFLGEFLASPLATDVHPSEDQPLGKYTQAAAGLVPQRDATVTPDQARQLVVKTETEYEKIRTRLADEKRKNRPGFDEQYGIICQRMHNTVVQGFHALATLSANEEVEFTADALADTMRELVGRLLTAVGMDKLEEIRQQELPEGFAKLVDEDGNYLIAGLATEAGEETESVSITHREGRQRAVHAMVAATP